MDSPLRSLHSEELNIMFYSCWRCVKAAVQTLPEKKKKKEEWFWSSSVLLQFFSSSDPNQNPDFAKSLSILTSGFQSSRTTPPSIPIPSDLGISLKPRTTTQVPRNLSFPTILYFRL